MHYNGIIAQRCQGICQDSRSECVGERGWTILSRTDFSAWGLEGIKGHFQMGLILL